MSRALNAYEEHFLKNPHPRRERLTTKLMQRNIGYGVTLRRWKRKKNVHSVIYA